MNPDKIICYCNNVTNAMIKEAIDNGANTLEEVQVATDAGTVCGACLDNLETLVKSLIAERNN